MKRPARARIGAGGAASSDAARGPRGARAPASRSASSARSSAELPRSRSRSRAARRDDGEVPTPPLPGPRKSHFRRFGAAYPEVAAAYAALGNATLTAGPLDERTRALVKLAIAVGAWREGAVHSAAGRARAAGCSPAAIRHVVVMATTTLGFPSMMAAMRWVDDVLGA